MNIGNVKALLYTIIILAIALAGYSETPAAGNNSGITVENAVVVVFSPSVSPLTINNQSEIISTGFAEVDALNREFEVSYMWPLFPRAERYGEYEMAGYYSITFNKDIELETVLSAYAGLDIIDKVEPVTAHRTCFTPNDTYYGSQWGLPKVEAEEAWDVGQGSPDIVLGITDTGVDWNHPDLEADIWINENDPIDGEDNDDNGFVDDYRGWDWVHGVNAWPGEDNMYADNDPMDFDGHGTHCSGIAAASTNNNLGVAGLGFNSRVMALRVGWQSTDGLGYIRMDFAAAAFYYAANNGAHALNCSWGSSNTSPLRNATNYAIAQGVVIITAAGNDDTSQAPYLGTRSDVIAVAATDQGDNKAGFSNYGTWVDVSAPGTAINSTYFDDTYYTTQGTSMAAPFVTGLVGLIWAAEPALTSQEVFDRILTTTDNIDDINPDYVGLLGTGRINAYTALAAHLYPRIEIIDYDITITEGDGDDVLNPGESFDLVVTLENIWSDAFDVTATVLEGEHYSVNDSIADFGDIAHSQARANTDQPFNLTIDGDINPGIVNLVIEIEASDTYSEQIELPLEVFLYQQGFPLNIIGSIEASSLIADFDDDDANELLFGANDSNVYAIESDGSNSPGWPQSVSDKVISGPAIGDIDSDNENEIVAVCKDGNVYAWNSDATLLDAFPVDLNGNAYGGPMLVDLDGDSDLEIVVGGFSEHQVYILHHTGEQADFSPVDGNAGWFGSAASADLDNDNISDIIYGGLDSCVHAWNYDGNEINGFPVRLNGPMYASVAVGDIDGDSFAEIMAITSQGNYYLINHDGSIENGYPRDVESTVLQSPALADINGDMVPEVIFGDNNRNLHAFNFLGQEINGFPVECDDMIKSSPVVADIDGNGFQDIIIGCSGGMLYGYDHYGNALSNFPIYCGTSADVKGCPALGDLDSDGDLEIACGLYNSGYANMVVIDYKSSAALDDLAWPNFAHDPWRSGYYPLDVPISIDSNLQLPAEFGLLQNYPNPFNASTMIEYNLPKAADVRIDIYDIMGRIVETLVAGNQPAGNHGIVWPAGHCASGIYFYKIETEGYSEVKRCTLLK
ncbi:MAG: S8 family serine peptidase [candidate division Zixibacteria bacterium]|nr:S8 family serine peptidase [candidate division Zixibacteria bacterium]